jgi:DNA-directed RNA polymerase subunit RPC12/RpoP
MKCPTCKSEVKRGKTYYYCDDCGFNINDKKEDKPNAGSDADNFNLKDVKL